LINLFQNAVDAIEGRNGRDGEILSDGEIHLVLTETNGSAVIEITDNGKGLPPEERDRLTEPYVTTRTKGTGLGLAIVKTVLEDHHAVLELEDRTGDGACVRVTVSVLSAGELKSLKSAGSVGTHGV
jgi:two-component system nitrogen regulation sensor histidine kinase NtrY